jgi:hypothetical protein
MHGPTDSDEQTDVNTTVQSVQDTNEQRALFEMLSSGGGRFVAD